MGDPAATSQAAVLVADSSGRIERANRHVEEVLGYEPAALEGEMLEDVLGPADTPGSHVRGADGRAVRADVIVGPAELEGGEKVVATIATPETRIEGLLEGEGQYRRLLDSSPAPIVIYDAEGVIRYANRAVADLLDVDGPDAIQGDAAIEYIHEDDRADSVEGMERVLEDRESVEGFERRIVTPDGEVRHAILSSVPITYDGEPAGQVLISDVTPLKEREAALERQNERLEAFASIVSHDLRNPLTVLESSLDLARETGEAEHFERAERAVDRMDDLTESLLAIARQGRTPERTEAVDLAAAARDAWDTVETGDAELRVEAEGTVEAEPSRLRELLENLVSNAVEHGGAGVTVVVEDSDGGFHVADDGVGIPPEERGTVFERGYSTADGGTGYGLAIVEEIAEAHGWAVSVTASDAGGARFEIATG